MKNIIAFYYSLHPKEIHHQDNEYFFECNGRKYMFQTFTRPLSDIDVLYKINKEMLKRDILMHEIIINNSNQIITYVNNFPYVLMEININQNEGIKLSEICYINNNSINIECDKIIHRYNWVELWKMKNDYYETQLNEICIKYPNLCSYVNYYIGLAENAICYVQNAETLEENALLSICHKRIGDKDKLLNLYNPLELIYDYRIRDVCEYVKTSFFNNKDALEIIKEFFSNNYFSYKEILIFYGRLLYPSYFFDLYDEIVNNNLSENMIEKLIIKSTEYEKFLFDVYIYISKVYNRYIPSVDWIIKRSFN